MNATATADPVRAQVEESLRQLVDSVATAPCRVVQRARNVVSTSVGLARSIAELAFGAVLGRGGNGTGGLEPAAATPPSSPLRAEVASEQAVVAPPAGALALEGYESLAASQVVARLDRLTHTELEQIREFELANRGRRTILGKVEQLLG
jgi:hypothetical protein